MSHIAYLAFDNSNPLKIEAVTDEQKKDIIDAVKNNKEYLLELEGKRVWADCKYVRYYCFSTMETAPTPVPNSTEDSQGNSVDSGTVTPVCSSATQCLSDKEEVIKPK